MLPEFLPPKDFETWNWKLIKARVSELLTASDWTQLPDSGLSFDKVTAWQEYRQTLRKIPTAYTLSTEVVFPVEPA